VIQQHNTHNLSWPVPAPRAPSLQVEGWDPLAWTKPQSAYAGAHVHCLPPYCQGESLSWGLQLAAASSSWLRWASDNRQHHPAAWTSGTATSYSISSCWQPGAILLLVARKQCNLQGTGLTSVQECLAKAPRTVSAITAKA